MRTLTEFNRVRAGLKYVLVVLLVLGVGQAFSSVPMLFAQPVYYAQFHDAAGIQSGDKIRIAGINVGLVESLQIEGDKILVGFTLGGRQIGNDSHAAIRTDTILGRRNIEIDPRGLSALEPNGVLPVGQTTTPYQIYDAIFDVTKTASGWDVDTVKRSLDVLSETIDQTYPHLDAALDGVKRFSDTIGKRDEQIKHLLANANEIATVLGDRSEQVNRLFVNAQQLVAALNERDESITLFLERTTRFEQQVRGLLIDNPNLDHVLEQLHTVTGILAERKNDLAEILKLLSKFAASLGETLASGPFFKAMLANLVPGQMLQPFIDSAFKKRGIDPEEFWRDAGLPAFRFPDPTGTRSANAAPPPAPPVLEGTPQHPGPAVPPGSPCSYAPPADGLPRPGDPLPCAHLSQGPFGPMPGGYPPPDVVTSVPNPDGLPPTPGIPIAGLPGQAPPPVPGTPMPLPPNAPPGARTEPLPAAVSPDQAGGS